jgi:hypothetical protein
MGGPPLLMEPVQAAIRFGGAKPREVWALDLYGVPKGDPLEAAADGGVRIDGRWGTYYYEVRR